MRAVVTLSGLHVPVDVTAQVFGAPVDCDMVVDADTITIDGRYTLQPDATDPHFLDVNLVGTAPVVTLGGVDSDFVGGVCSIPGIEQIVGLFLPDVEDMMRTSLTSLLGDADGSGPADAPVAEAVEGALGQLNIAGDIGTALGLTLDSTLQSADEDPAGIGLRATAAFTAAGVAPGRRTSPGRSASRRRPRAAAADHAGGLPFDVAVGASATGFNQPLAGETERGLLNVDVTSIGGVPLSLKALYDLVGAGGLVTEDRPLAIALRPEVAPIVTTAEGPGDALGEMLFHGYRATITTTDDNRVFLELVLDFRTGVGMRAGRRRPGLHLRPAGGRRPRRHHHPEPQQAARGAGRPGLRPAGPAGVRGRAGRAAQLPAARLRRAGAGAGRDRPGRVRVRAVRRPGPGRLSGPQIAHHPPGPGPTACRALVRRCAPRVRRACRRR